VPLWSVQNCPRLFYPDQPVSPHRSDGCLQIRNFEEEHGLVFRRIGFDPLLFKAINPAWQLCVVPFLPFGKLQSQNAGIVTFRLLQIVAIEFDSDQSLSPSVPWHASGTNSKAAIHQSVCFSTPILSFSTIAVESDLHVVRGRKYLLCCQYSFSHRRAREYLPMIRIVDNFFGQARIRLAFNL